MRDKVVQRDYLDDPRAAGKKVLVSTVRLTIDHGFGGRPLWYETMIFAANDDGTSPANFRDLYCARYETLEEARSGHDAVVAKTRAGEWVGDERGG